MNKLRLLFTHAGRALNPHSLRYQLLSRTLYVLFAVLLLVGILQYVFLSGFLVRNTANNVMSELRTITPHTVQPPAEAGGAYGPFGFSTPITSLGTIDSKYQMNNLPGFSNYGSITKLPNVTYQNVMESAQGEWQIIDDSKGARELLVLVPLMSPSGVVGVIQATSPLGELDSILRRDLAIYIMLALCAFLGSILVLIPTLRRTLRPLSAMVHTVGQINAGNLDERFTPNRPQAEIALLSNSFNAMLERLRESFEKEREANAIMRQFVADASHELRTPLTSIHGFLEVLIRGAANNPEQLKKSLVSMHGESERMKKLVNDLILLARLDDELRFDMRESHLDVVVHDLMPHLQVLAGDRKVSVSLESDVLVRMDADRIKQVLLNLFQNAVQHTHPIVGKIEVSVVKLGTEAILTVRDNGAGIPPEHLSRLFERFYRVDSSRARKEGGAGLGLSIVKSIVDVHGGRILCKSVVGQGSTFYVHLPL